MVKMLLPLQGDYVTHLMQDRALPYPNAPGPFGAKKIRKPEKIVQLKIGNIYTTIFKEIQTYYETN